MQGSNDGLTLTVQVPADEWAYVQRRTKYLEAVLLQVLKDETRIKEWFDAGEIAEMRLPGLPASKSGIARIAKAHNWRRYEVKGRGGKRYLYHYSSLPARAFDNLVGRITGFSMPEEDAEPVPEIQPAPPVETPEPDNAAPSWVLPFMRLLKNEAKGDFEAAWQSLPAHLPKGVFLPSADDAAATLLRLGLA